MRVLVVNDYVRQGSGIDASVALEVRTLRARGHEVVELARDNHDLDRLAPAARALRLASSLYSVSAYREMDRLLSGGDVDVVHLHNLTPFITGSVFDACQKHGAPTVQHLHNYRAFCLSSYAIRDGRPCDACAGTAFAACAARGCYRGSLLASAGLTAARWIDWSRGRRSGSGADLYIANSDFTARRHVEHGLPEGRVCVLHNPVEDLAALLPAGPAGAAAKKLTFVGSLIREKGPWLALELAAALPEFEVQFIGSGRDEPEVSAEAARRRLGNVVFRGLLGGAEKAAAWADSFLTLVPSLWDEPFGLVAPESYSLGVPVLATAAGGLAEIVADGETGLLLDPADVAGSAARVRALWDDAARARRMRAAARAAFERRFSEAVFAPRLEELLAEAAGRGTRGRAPSPVGRHRSAPA